MVNKRTEYVSLPLFLEEKNRLKNLATKLNLPVSTILRNSVFEFIKKMDAES